MRLLHIVPEWPSTSQTFVKDDISVLNQYVETVIFPLRLNNKANFRGLLILPNGKTGKAISKIELLLLVFALVTPQNLTNLRKNRFAISGIPNLFRYYYISKIVLKNIAKLGDESQEKLLIHAHFAAGPAFIGVLISQLLQGSELVVTCHGAEVIFAEERWLRFLDSYCVKYICASKFVMDSLIANHGPRPDLVKYTLRYCRVPFAAMRRDRTRNAVVNILTVGRMHPQKGWNLVLPIAEILHENELEFTWTCVGDGGLFKEFENSIKASSLSGSFILTKALSRPLILKLMAGSDILVQPSLVTGNETDGLPVVILEAMSLGCPVISTNVAGIPEAIGAGNGILVSPIPASFAAAIEQLSDEFVYLETSQSARNWIEKHIFETRDPLVSYYMTRTENPL